ncbi:ATP-dependent RecD-like DNA helicase [Candidatus Dependentiae bacterium]|nr:ATP-dependent RecD-like DNA helicase [Candidatus Dependentiae bacterium]
MNSDQITGIIDRILFQNNETGFSVFIVKSKKYDPITITGSFVGIQAGQEIHVQGTWAFHPKFGKQLQATSYSTALPSSILGIKKYLSSGFIKGIGPVYAEKIVQYFKENTLTIIDENPERLFEVDGIGQKRVGQIKTSWSDQKYIAKIMVFLQEKGVSTIFATKIYKKYGHESIAKLTQNPYRLTDDIWGIGFKTADKIAQNMGFATGSVERIQAGILFTLQQENNNGHCYQEVESLKQRSFQLLEIDQEFHQGVMKKALTLLYHQDKIKLITYQEKHFVGLCTIYGCEKAIAQKALTLLSSKIKHTLDPHDLYKNLQKIMSTQLNEDQQHGILKAFEHKLSIITGGPGTGKTTLVKAFIQLLEHYKFSYKLAAPTGRAAKRLMEGTHRHATTVHRLLEFDPATMRFTHDDKNCIKTDFLILDETSMIDIFLANSIFKAISLDTHIIMIGDVDQLPSVGPGSILKDLINTQIVPCTKLTQIFRQAQNSMIIQNAHRINQGQFPTTDLPECKKDFYFIKEETAEQCFNSIEKILTKIIPQHEIDLTNVTILTPMNKGIVGTQSLNHALQQLLNPDQSRSHHTFMGTVFRVGDRVMQIKNNYDKNIFNGDIGTIADISQDDSQMIIDFEGTKIHYDFDELNELVLAYAISIHKSQGSEYDAVIIPIFMQHFMLLQKNLIYTAITRAKKLCFFIGQTKAIAMGIKNNKQEERITFLKQQITEQITCR